MKKDDFEIYKDCGMYRLVCTDYDRDTYLPSLIINRTGAEIMKSLRKGMTVQDIANELASDGVSPDEAANDIDEFLKAVSARGYRIDEDIDR